MTDRFYLVFFSVLVLTILCAVLASVIAFYTGADPPPLMDKLFNAFLGMFTFGAGAIVGLLGGRGSMPSADRP